MQRAPITITISLYLSADGRTVWPFPNLLQNHERQLGRKGPELIGEEREKPLGEISEELGQPRVASSRFHSPQHDARMLAGQLVRGLAQVDGRKTASTPKLRGEAEGKGEKRVGTNKMLGTYKLRDTNRIANFCVNACLKTWFNIKCPSNNNPRMWKMCLWKR